MATTAQTLIRRCRRFMRDWPENDSLTASCTSITTTLTVADATMYGPGTLIQIDSEAMQVRSGVGTTLTVLRGARASTNASHASGATVLNRPRFIDKDYVEALNSGIDASFPWMYQSVVDESITTDTSTYEYTIPNLNSVPIRYLSKLYFKESGDLSFRKFESWDVMRGATPKIKLRRPLPIGTLRVVGYGPIPALADENDSLSTVYPTNAEDALVMYATQYLLAAGEAARVREDTGARDQRENANRVGGAIAASNQIFTRFQRRLMDSGMPPMPKHAVSLL